MERTGAMSVQVGRLARGGLLALSAVLLSSCVTFYTDYPRISKRYPEVASTDKALAYHINKWPVSAWGKDVLEPEFEKSGMFKTVTRKTGDGPVPSRGVYVDVMLQSVMPSVPAAISGYVSLSTLTLWPTYSGTSGYEVTYNLYVDNVLKKEYKYEIERKVGIWLPLALVSWLNLLLPRDVDAFLATTRQFLADVRTDGIL